MIWDSRLEDVIESCALKASLSRTCFSHPSLSLLHAKNIKEQIEEFTKENVRYVVIEAAVLLNAGWYDMCDSIIVAATDRDIARDRLIKRNSLTPKEALRRLNAQQSNAERIASANQRDMKGGVHVVWNNGTEEELEDTVNQVCVQMKKRFK